MLYLAEQGRTWGMTTLTESEGPGPWGAGGARRAFKRGPGGPQKRRKKRENKIEGRKENRRAKRYKKREKKRGKKEAD